MEKAKLTRDGNIFRQAVELLKAKDKGAQLTEEERKLLGAATIPLVILPRFNDTPTSEGLEQLAKIIEEERKDANNHSRRPRPGLS